MTDDYSDHPLTVGEIKSDKTGRSKDWTARDALIATLREIDNGRAITDLIIVVHERDAKGENSIQFRAVAPDSSTAVGMLTQATHLIIDEQLKVR